MERIKREQCKKYCSDTVLKVKKNFPLQILSQKGGKVNLNLVYSVC